jgi:hypothetical protein
MEYPISMHIFKQLSPPPRTHAGCSIFFNQSYLLEECMRKLAVIGTMIFLFIAFGVIAFAATEYRYQEGTCPTGGTWWSVTRYENGDPVHIEGRNCKGERYYRPLGKVVQTTNPTAGMTATHAGSCDIGSASPGWHSVIEYNADYAPAWMGGQDCNGNYWTITEFTDEEAGPGGEE